MDKLKYLNETERRNSFKSWNYTNKYPCNINKMAEAGFVFVEKDTAECFLCNKRLDGWESDDDPWKEHLKHSPQCEFAKLQKSQNKLILEEFIALKKNCLNKLFFDYSEDLKLNYRQAYDEMYRFNNLRR